MKTFPLLRRAALALGFGLALATTNLATADGLPAPQGRVILTISGNIAHSNQGKDAAFDMAMLETLPQHSFTTHTPWFDKPVKFTGPRLADVLAAVKAQGQTIHASAINDYTIRIPVADAAEGVIVARLLDDKPMAVRDKGPLFVVYPFDSKTSLRSSVYYERSIWQLKRMSIE